MKNKPYVFISYRTEYSREQAERCAVFFRQKV